MHWEKYPSVSEHLSTGPMSAGVRSITNSERTHALELEGAPGVYCGEWGFS